MDNDDRSGENCAINHVGESYLADGEIYFMFSIPVTRLSSIRETNVKGAKMDVKCSVWDENVGEKD